jgi:hypothetical protein
METNKRNDQSVKDIIKPFLSKGDIQEIAKKHNCTIYNVNKVLNERVNNPLILESLIEKAEFAKSVKQRLDNLKVA